MGLTLLTQASTVTNRNTCRHKGGRDWHTVFFLIAWIFNIKGHTFTIVIILNNKFFIQYTFSIQSKLPKHTIWNSCNELCVYLQKLVMTVCLPFRKTWFQHYSSKESLKEIFLFLDQSQWFLWFFSLPVPFHLLNILPFSLLLPQAKIIAIGCDLAVWQHLL